LSDAQCSGGGADSDGYCYAFVNKPTTWADASSQCQQTGGQLVSVYNESIQNRIKSLLVSNSNYGAPVWTAAKQEESNDMIGYSLSLWRWVKGQLSFINFTATLGYMCLILEMGEPYSHPVDSLRDGRTIFTLVTPS